MDESRLLILGAGGQLGLALKAQFPTATPADRGVLDISDPQALAKYDWSRVDVILNAAAYTKVDEAETPEGRRAAWAVNGTAVTNLARVATEHDLTLVHISTDYVFDGTQEVHHEDEPLAPLSVYGASKAAGDIAVQTTKKHYILRTSWVIGEGKNFVLTMMGLAQKNISPNVVDDQIGRLTFTGTLVDIIKQLITTNAAYGTYNATNQGDVVSWADVTRAVFGELGRDDLHVTGVSTADYFKDKPNTAARPLHSAYDLSKIEATGLVLRDWRDDLALYVKQHKETV